MKTASDYALEEALERALSRRRENFIADYEIGSSPALVWQCLPVGSVKVDVSSKEVRGSLQQGAGGASSDSWWYGFKAGRLPVPVFDGFASAGPSDAFGWATQIHSDGHLIAALWRFPEGTMRDGSPAPALLDFHAQAFLDFGHFARNVYTEAGIVCSIVTTCTMANASKLPLVDGQGRWSVAAPKRETLRWEFVTCTRLEALHAAAEAMALQLMRAYGKSTLNVR